jgi:iron complex transport system substrate-binding protein
MRCNRNSLPGIGFFAVALAVFLTVGCANQTTPPAPTSAPAVPSPTVPTTVQPTPAVPTAVPMTVVDGPLAVVDGAGRAITLPKEPNRIVSLAPSNTEILYALGLGESVVGVTPFCDFPVEAKTKKHAVGMDQRVNKEELVSLAPDLVLAAGITNPEDVKVLEGLGIPVFTVGKPLGTPSSIEDVLADIEAVGAITGRTVEAKDIADQLRLRVQNVFTKIAVLSYAPSVFYELDATEPTKPFTAGPGSFVDSLIMLAGGHNVASDAKLQWAQLSSEEIIRKNPEIIILGDAKYGVSVDDVLTRPGWSGIRAVQNNKVFPIDDDLISRPGPRVVDGLEEMAEILHPALFERN